MVVVPVGALEGAKSRLGAALDAEERRDLVLTLLDRTLGAVVALPEIAETIVITPDDDVRGRALASGARPIRQRGTGLNAGLRQARDDALAGGASAILILPIDLPRISPEGLREVLATLDEPGPLVTLVSDRHRRGTNALLVAPPDAIEPEFGGDSRAAHRAAAREAGARYVEISGPLSIDLDTPEDLLLAESLAAETADAV